MRRMVAQSNLLREEGLEIHYATYMLDKSAFYGIACG
jgi:hypothetical protein